MGVGGHLRPCRFPPTDRRLRHGIFTRLA